MSTYANLNNGFTGMKIQIEAKHIKLSIKWVLEKEQYETQYAIINKHIIIVNNAQKPSKQKKLTDRKNRQWLIV